MSKDVLNKKYAGENSAMDTQHELGKAVPVNFNGGAFNKISNTQ